MPENTLGAVLGAVLEIPPTLATRILTRRLVRDERQATIRAGWITGGLAAQRVPDLGLPAEPVVAPTLREAARRWQESRVDVAENTGSNTEAPSGCSSPFSATGASTRSQSRRQRSAGSSASTSSGGPPSSAHLSLRYSTQLRRRVFNRYVELQSERRQELAALDGDA